MSESRSVTLRDVAAVSGVSVSTVSKVLNGRGNFSAATHVRIQDAVARLGFEPDALAQSFATGRSQVVGMLTQFAPAAFTSPVMIGASTAFGQRYQAVLFSDAHDHGDSSALLSFARKLRSRRVDGLLVIGDGLHRPMPSISLGMDLPVVYVFAQSSDPRDISFVPDNELAGRLATQHLVDLGRRRIAHVGVPGHLDAEDRLRGCREVLGEHGLSLVGGRAFEAPHHRGESGWRSESGAAATRLLLDSGLDFDAVFCVNDQTAMGCLSVLQEAGRAVPDDVAVVGVDHWERMVGIGSGRLSTVETDLQGLGAAAAEHLLEVVAGRGVPGVHRHPGHLVLGRSSLGESEIPARPDPARQR